MTKVMYNSRLIAMAWLLIVVVTTAFAMTTNPVFDSSIMSLLPKSDQQPRVQQATEKMSDRFSKRLILLLSADDDKRLRETIPELAGELTALTDISKIDWKVDASIFERIKKEAYPYRFSILEARVRQLLLEGKGEQIRDRALLRLYSPFSVGKGSLVDDPFAFFEEAGLAQTSEFNIQLLNSLIKVTGTKKPTYMMMLSLSGDPFSSAIQGRVLSEISAQSEQLKQQGIALRMSGMLLHAEAGARQAKHEILTIGIGSLIGIVVVMLLVFRRFRILLLLSIPLVVGCSMALAVTILLFGGVHLVTLAFGASLVGVSIDYGLHFLCERQVSAANRVLQRILPGLFLGLLSSVLAYAAQAFAPFPGLQQMAVFSVVGLIASWLTVVLCLPLLTQHESLHELPIANQFDKILVSVRGAGNQYLLILVLSVMAVLSLKIVMDSKSLDDIRLLQTSPESLLAQEKEVQTLLGASSSSQFLLINEGSLELCLQTEERLERTLRRLKHEGLLQEYQAVSQQLPSLKRQSENVSLVKTLYKEQLKTLYDKLQLSNERLFEANQKMEQASQSYLTPESWLQQKRSDMWQSLIVTKNDAAGAATIIRFIGNVEAEAKLALLAMADQESGVQYIDQVQNISDLMSSYRKELTKWIALAYLMVLVLLIARYRRRVWQIIVPPLLASLFTLAVLVSLEQGINLFHLMALFLVLGIGLDMGIFLTETAESSHTWVAVSLSAYTSLLAFGLLAMSKTPVLHYFGLTVLIGLVFVWLLGLMIRKNKLIGES